MCLVATLEKKEIKTFESVRHPNHVIEPRKRPSILFSRPYRSFESFFFFFEKLSFES